MGIIHLSIIGEDCYSYKDFLQIFGSLSQGHNEINLADNFSGDELNEILNEDKKNLRILITCKTEKRYFAGFNTDKNIMLIDLKKVEPEDHQIYILNLYLHLLSSAFLKPSNKEVFEYLNKVNQKFHISMKYQERKVYGLEVIVYLHRPDTCVNSLKRYLNEKRDKWVQRFISKKGMCLSCFQRFDDSIKEKFINGIRFATLFKKRY